MGRDRDVTETERRDRDVTETEGRDLGVTETEGRDRDVTETEGRDRDVAGTCAASCRRTWGACGRRGGCWPTSPPPVCVCVRACVRASERASLCVRACVRVCVRECVCARVMSVCACVRGVGTDVYVRALARARAGMCGAGVRACARARAA